MRLQRPINKAIEHFPLAVRIKHVPDLPDIDDESSSKEVEISDGELKEKILLAQRVKHSLEIENLAASDLESVFPDTRRDAARKIGNKSTVWWSDCKALNSALSGEYIAIFGRGRVVDAITWSMAEVLNKLRPDEIETGKYLDSHLMDVAQCKYTAGWGFNEIYSSSKENAARALRIIVEKIGERLEDENEIIKKLLNASSPSIR